MLPLHQSFLARPAFRNPGSQRPGRKAGARKMYLWWKTIKSGNTYAWDAPMSAEEMG